jgi:dihydrofolate reductase
MGSLIPRPEVHAWATGAVTRIIITRIPILIGSGVPLFGPVDSDIDLRLIRSQAFENGWIQDEYEVVS